MVLKNHTVACLKRLSKSQPNQGQTVLNYSMDQNGGTASLTSWKFDQKAIRLALCEMITCDCWTAMNTNFICVTAHCIGKDWKLHQKIISLKVTRGTKSVKL